MAIRHTKTDTIPDWTQPELDAQIALGNYPSGTVLADIVLPSDWNADHTNPDIADVTGLQDFLDELQASIDKVPTENIFRPETFAVGDYSYCKTSGTGENLGGGLFRDLDYPFTADDVGKTFWQDGAVVRTITAVDGSGVATISPDPYGGTNINYVVNGYDWTDAIQAAWDAAAAVSGDDLEDTDAAFAGPRMGGVVLLEAGKKYGVFNSSASYSGGKLSCLIMRRRTTFTTAFSVNETQGVIVQLPKSYGHVMAPPSTTTHMDFTTVANITIECIGDFSSNSLNGIDFEIEYDNLPRVDAFNRFERITVRQAKVDGFRFSGRGELKIRDCDAFSCGGKGMFIDDQYDWSLIGGQFGGNRNTGFYVYASGAGNATGFKSFYSGSNGGSDPKKCANLVVTGDQMRHGFVWMSNFQLQESRGSGLYVDVGNCYFDNFQALDPSTTALIASGTLPSIRAGVHIAGEGARMNSFYGTVSSSVAVFRNPNWNADTYAVYIDDVDGDGAGPQLNEGHIKTYRPTTNLGGGTQVGNQYSGTGSVKGGGGVTNGKNPDLYIDGVPCAATLGAAPASGDLIEIIDVSDTYSSASGTKKLVAYSDFGGGGGGTTLTTVEKELGSIPKMAGKFTISGTGLTIGKPVSVMKAVGPYTGKGTRADEAEMDAITATGVVTSATEITVYWNAATRVKGNVKFNYFVGA